MKEQAEWALNKLELYLISSYNYSNEIMKCYDLMTKSLLI
jgi:hypothetical protein